MTSPNFGRPVLVASLDPARAERINVQLDPGVSSTFDPFRRCDVRPPAAATSAAVHVVVHAVPKPPRPSHLNPATSDSSSSAARPGDDAHGD